MTPSHAEMLALADNVGIERARLDKDTKNAVLLSNFRKAEWDFHQAASPATVKALVERVVELERLLVEKEDQFHGAKLHAARLAAALKNAEGK